MKHVLLVAVLSLSTIDIKPAYSEVACKFEVEPKILLEEGGAHEVGSRLLQRWDVQNHPVYWTDTDPEDGPYHRFRAEVAELVTETDAVRLLERNRTENNLLVARNADEWISPAGCLEKLMIGYQHARLNTFTDPTEFGSMILRSPNEDHLRVYYITVNQDGLGNMDLIVEHVLKDKQNGWDVLVALHSHVFHPGQAEIDGILAPSEPDADFHVRFRAVSDVQEAWITNGVDTVRMPASSFDKFKRPSEATDEDRVSK